MGDNMREIKLRSWCKLDNKYVEPYTVQEMIFIKDSDIPLDVLYNEFEFEQYTGIKDKYGVEIYEGDVVQYGSDKDFRYIVIFKYGCFYAHNMLGNKFMLDSLLGSLLMSEKVSVIGNIHENAELLQE